MKSKTNKPHEGEVLVGKLLKLVDRKPAGLCIAATSRLLCIIVEGHENAGGWVNVPALHAEIDQMLAGFRLLRGKTGGSA